MKPQSGDPSIREILAILFDVDGVLVDATDWHFDSFNRALAPFGATISRQQHEEEFIGLPTAAKIDKLVARGVLTANVGAAVLEAKHLYFREILRARCRQNSVGRQVLGSLRANGFVLAAVSNAIRQSVVEMLDLSGLTSYLSAIVCGDDVAHPKPDPEIYISCSTLLGIRPDMCLAIEDGKYGIQAAMAAGMRVLTVKSIGDVNLGNIWAALRRRGPS
jgi:HAD superfamily hydrolase (TIGR01509 family)